MAKMWEVREIETGKVVYTADSVEAAIGFCYGWNHLNPEGDTEPRATKLVEVISPELVKAVNAWAMTADRDRRKEHFIPPVGV